MSVWPAHGLRKPALNPNDIADWSFFGPGRVAELELGNGLFCTHMNNARTNSAVQSSVSNPAWGDRSSDRLGYDGAGRLITKRYLDATASASGYSATAALVGFTTAYDHGSNKRYERHLHAESRSHLYPGLDSLDRLLQYQRGTLQEAGNGDVTVATAISLSGTDSDRTYDLDGLGNWNKTTYTPAGTPQAVSETRAHNLVNQVTRFATTDVAYDHGDNGATAREGNGNIVDDGTRVYAYDAFNRLVTVSDTTPTLLVTYTYDAMGRRIRKVIEDLNGGTGGLTGDIPAGTTDYLYTNVQCVEERDGADAVDRHYVWGAYVDELIQQREDPDGGETDYYPLSDLLYRTTALTDSSGDIQEVYDTDAYGNTLIYDADGDDDIWFTDDDVAANDPTCPFIFTGRRYDPETQIYFYRARYYHPQLGRFLSRDPIGPNKGPNPYEYVKSAATRHMDPSGLVPTCLPRGVREDLQGMKKDLETAKAKCLTDANKALKARGIPNGVANVRAHSETSQLQHYPGITKVLAALKECIEREQKWFEKQRKELTNQYGGWKCCGATAYDPKKQICCGEKVYNRGPKKCCVGNAEIGELGTYMHNWERFAQQINDEEIESPGDCAEWIIKNSWWGLEARIGGAGLVYWPIGVGALLGKGGQYVRAYLWCAMGLVLCHA